MLSRYYLGMCTIQNSIVTKPFSLVIFTAARSETYWFLRRKSESPSTYSSTVSGKETNTTSIENSSLFCETKEHHYVCYYMRLLGEVLLYIPALFSNVSCVILDFFFPVSILLSSENCSSKSSLVSPWVYDVRKWEFFLESKKICPIYFVWNSHSWVWV